MHVTIGTMLPDLRFATEEEAAELINSNDSISMFSCRLSGDAKQILNKYRLEVRGCRQMVEALQRELRDIRAKSQAETRNAPEPKA